MFARFAPIPKRRIPHSRFSLPGHVIDRSGEVDAYGRHVMEFLEQLVFPFEKGKLLIFNLRLGMHRIPNCAT